MLVFLVKWEIYKVARLTLPFKLLEGFNENDVAEENLKINKNDEARDMTLPNIL